MSFQVDYYTLDATDATNQYFNLSGTPLSSTNVAMDLIGGTAQAHSGDFGVDGTRIEWDSTVYGLHDLMAEGDQIRIIYDRS